MGTTTLKSLLQLFSETIGDYLTFDTTTNITTDKSVISTTLNQFDGGQDGAFDDWWLYIDGTTNAGTHRKTGSTTYATATGTLYVYGANLVAETAARTCYLHRYSRDNKKIALNRGIEQASGLVFKKLDDLTLVTGNILPDGSFEWWTSATAPKFYASDGTYTVTLAQTTTAGSYRGQRGTTSMKVTSSATDGFARISSNDYPRLLDLMGRTVSAYVRALPEVANDAEIEIYTKQADGTAQTLTSTTANPAGEFTLLELEDQTLNDDLVEVEIRFRVSTNTKYAYFDDAVVCGMNLHEYMLPESFQDGHVSQVSIQTTGYSDKAYSDILPRNWDKQEFRIRDDGTYRYLNLKDLNSSYHRIRLLGYTPLSSLSADTDTIEVDGKVLNLIVAKAAAILYRLEQGSISSEDKGRFSNQINMWENEYRKLAPVLGMSKPSDTLWT